MTNNVFIKDIRELKMFLELDLAKEDYFDGLWQRAMHEKE
jgi:hypothetical protein